METVYIDADPAGLTLQGAQDLARHKAREINPQAMLLAWYDAPSGKGYPDFDCGQGDKRPWQVFADSRGGNLTIDINDGTYRFIFLKL